MVGKDMEDNPIVKRHPLGLGQLEMKGRIPKPVRIGEGKGGLAGGMSDIDKN